jgi:hypothetical protein
LVKPFSKSALILALEKRHNGISPKSEEIEESYGDEVADFSILEKRIDILTQEYKENILKAVRAFYEK